MSLRRHDLNLLVILEAILRTGSITAAARTLNLTQPAVSQALQRARDMFGDTLLLRTGHGMVPTARGTSLRSRLPEILDRISDVLAAPEFDPRLANRTFTIATGDLGETIFLPRVLARLAAGAPKCRFEIIPARHEYSDDVPDLLLMGAAHPRGPWLSHDLFTDTFVLMARKRHPALKGRLSLKAFCALPQILVSPRGGGFAGPVDDALGKLGMERPVVMSVPRFGALPLILAESNLVAAVPERFASLPLARESCGARKLPLDVPPYTMKLIWHRSRDGDPAQMWLRQMFVAWQGP